VQRLLHCATPAYHHCAAETTLTLCLCLKSLHVQVLELTSNTLLGAYVAEALTVSGYVPSSAPLSSCSDTVCVPAIGTSILAVVLSLSIASTSPMKLMLAGTYTQHSNIHACTRDKAVLVMLDSLVRALYRFNRGSNIMTSSCDRHCCHTTACMLMYVDSSNYSIMRHFAATHSAALRRHCV
jgi:hypothetical protein